MDKTKNLTTKDFDKDSSTKEYSKKDNLIKALIAGEESGFVKEFERDTNLKWLHINIYHLQKSIVK